MLSLRIINVDHYMCTPKSGLDITYSQFRGSQVKSAPVIRIFGSTLTGGKTCLHIHGVFPYVLVPFSGEEDPGKTMYQLANSLDKAINISLGSSHSNKQHVFKIVLVSGRPFYGYHGQDHQFLKIFFYNPFIIKRASDLLQNGAVCGTKFQLHESHVPFILQFFIDYNLYGMSFIHLKSVVYRKNASPPGVIPGTLEKESASEFEADAVAVDILNRLTVKGELAVNPGLAAIWKEEKERLKVNNIDTSQRPTQHVAMSEILLKDKLLDNLKFQGTCKPVLKEIVPYPAETQRSVNSDIMNASVLDTHSISSLHSMSMTDDEMPIVDEELVLNLSQQFDSLNSLDQSLLVALDNLAARNEDFDAVISQNVEDDSILGSQMMSPEGNCDFQDLSDDIEMEDESSCNDVTLVGSDQDSEDSIDNNIPQLDGIGDVLTTKKRKSQRIAKNSTVDNVYLETSQPFEGSEILLNNIKDCWPESGKEECLDEIFSDDEPFNSPIHNFEESVTAQNDQVTIDSINTFDTVLRGDPSFTCEEMASADDVFLQSKNASVAWNSLDVDEMSDKKYECNYIFSSTPEISLKLNSDNSSSQFSKNEKNVQLSKSKCISNITVPLPSNSLENVDSEKCISLLSCSDDLFNTSQLDEMFDQDLNKGLEIIYENNSQTESIGHEIRSIRQEEVSQSERTVDINSVSDKEITTVPNVSPEEISNAYFNELFTEVKTLQNESWDDSLNHCDILSTNTPTDDNCTVTLGNAQLKKNPSNKRAKRLSSLPNTESSAKDRTLVFRKDENSVVALNLPPDPIPCQISPIASGSPKMKNNGQMIENQKTSSEKNKKTKTTIGTSLEQKGIIRVKFLAPSKAPIYTPNAYKMTKAEIERYFFQLEEIASKLSNAGSENLDELIKWTPIRNSSDYKTIKKRKKKITNLKEKQTVKQMIYNEDIHKLTSCYVKLIKLTNKNMKSLCKKYKITKINNEFKPFKSSIKRFKLKQSSNSTKKGEIQNERSKIVGSQRLKNNQGVAYFKTDSQSQDKSFNASKKSEVSVNMDDQKENNCIKVDSRNLKDKGKSIPIPKYLDKNVKNITPTKTKHSLSKVYKLDIDNFSTTKEQHLSCETHIESPLLDDLCINSNKLCNLTAKDHGTESLEKTLKKLRKHNLKKSSKFKNIDKDVTLNGNAESQSHCFMNESYKTCNSVSDLPLDAHINNTFDKKLEYKKKSVCEKKSKLKSIQSANSNLVHENLKKKAKHKINQPKNIHEENRIPEVDILSNGKYNVKNITVEKSELLIEPLLKVERIPEENGNVNVCLDETLKNTSLSLNNGSTNLLKNQNITSYKNKKVQIVGEESGKINCKDLTICNDRPDHVIQDLALTLTETNNNDCINSNQPQNSILSVSIPKLKGLRKTHTDKEKVLKNSSESHTQSFNSRNKDCADINEQIHFNTTTSRTTSLIKNRPTKCTSKHEKINNNYLNKSDLKQSRNNKGSSKYKCKTPSSTKNKPSEINNIIPVSFNDTFITSHGNSSNLSKDLLSCNSDCVTTNQKENFYDCLVKESSEVRIPFVHMVKLDHAVESKINNLSLKTNSYKKRISKIYSLDGTVDNSSSSDENIEEKSNCDNGPSTSLCLTSYNRKGESTAQNSPITKNKYVPLNIEIKKSPKRKLSANNEKASLFVKDVKTSEHNQSEHSEIFEERKRLEPFIRVQRLSLPSKPNKPTSKCRHNNTKIEQSTYSLDNETNSKEDQPFIKKLKVSIQRLPSDLKGVSSDHKEVVSSHLLHNSSSLSTISKDISEAENRLQNISNEHLSIFQEDNKPENKSLKSGKTEKGNKVRKVLKFSSVCDKRDINEKSKSIDISDVSTQKIKSRKSSIDFFDLDSSSETNKFKFISTNEKPLNVYLSENSNTLSSINQFSSDILECSKSTTSDNFILDVSLHHREDTILKSNAQVRNSTLFKPVFQPPTRAEVVMNMKELGLEEVLYEEPFYSDPNNVAKSHEVGSTVLRLKSKSVVHLEEYEGTFKGITHWRQEMAENVNQYPSHSGADKMAMITPLKEPPSALDARLWLENRLLSVNNKIGIVNKYPIKVVLPKSPANLTDEEDDTMTISQSTQTNTPVCEMQSDSAISTPQDLSLKGLGISPVMSSTPLFSKYMSLKKQYSKVLESSHFSSLTTITEETDIKESSPLSTNSCCLQAEPASTSQPALSETAIKRILSETKSPACVSGRIDIATPNNSGNYRMDLENLQDIKTAHEHQYLTIMAMELHIHTRGELRPNPDHDAICCIFYTINNDVPDPLITNISGLIYVASDAKQSKMPQFNCEVLAVPDELALINAFVASVKKWDPDIFVGYEIEMLSWGFLLQRAYVLNVNLTSELSRVKVPSKSDDDNREVSKDGAEIQLSGRIVLDLWRFLRHEVSLQSYTFENIVYHVLHQRVPTFSFQTLTMWWCYRSHIYRWKVIEHYLFRVEGIIKLMQQVDLVGRTSEFARLFGIQFYEVLSRGSQFRVESMMLRLVKPLNYIAVSPSIQQRAKMRAPESLPLIMEPQSRFYSDPVIVLDFQSLYPSIIIAYNYCYSTCMGRVEHLGRSQIFEFGCTQLKVPVKELFQMKDSLNFSPCGVAFVSESVRKGVLPRMLEEILNTRLMVKQSMKENKNNKTLQRVLHNRQLGLKLIANVTYGYTSANFSGRMPCIEVGDSVVSKARETLERAISLVGRNSQWGAKVIYGDTDSMFVLVPGKTKEEAFRIGAEIAEAVTNDNPKPVKLKLEKVYQPCILQTKKRYVGYMYESPNQETPVYDAKGIETVRRDGCPAVAKILEKSLRILFEHKDVSLIKQYVCQQFSKVISGRISIQELTFAREYRGARGYKPGACVPALELAKQWQTTDPRAEPRVGERVPYIIVAGPPGLPLIRLVRSPKHFLSDDSLKINAEYYISRVIIPPLERCFSLIGAQVATWYAELPRKQHLHLPTYMPENSKKATISQYFVTTHCAVCHVVTTGQLCNDCQLKPQCVAVTLSNRVRAWERKKALVNKVCSSCCGRPFETDCISFDCPVLYRRNQANCDVNQANYIRTLQQQFLF